VYSRLLLVSRVILAVLFLRYVVFEDPDAAKKEREAAKLRDGGTASGGDNAGADSMSRRKERRRMRSTTDNVKLNVSTQVIGITITN
jgi:hypothetical protein